MAKLRPSDIGALNLSSLDQNEAGPSSQANQLGKSPTVIRGFKKLQNRFAVAGRRASRGPPINISQSPPLVVESPTTAYPFDALRSRDDLVQQNDANLGQGEGSLSTVDEGIQKDFASPPALPPRPWLDKPEGPFSDGYEWTEESDDDYDNRPENYSWIDPSIVGTEDLRRTPIPSTIGHGDNPRSPLGASPSSPIPPNKPRRPVLQPAESYSLLIAFQTHQQSPISHPLSSSTSHSHALANSSPASNNHDSSGSSSGHVKKIDGETEWHELVDDGLLESLSKEEQRRQGLWWELIKAEEEYVRDLGIICNAFVEPLKSHDPPILKPEARLHAFIAEVFSSVQTIFEAHSKLLDKLLDRQRNDWPLLTSATDLMLSILLELLPSYDAYMKNYPFADSRVRREKGKNPAFTSFLHDRNTLELTKRRDVTIFLSRPVSRLPRLLLLLEALTKYTPPDHPDTEDLPTLMHVLNQTVKGSQPGIEAAEAKIKLWNVAEKLLFKKGEILELDMSEPKRSLVYSGYLFRRIRSETAWHGWQDLHAFLLDHYFLLTRDAENGKHVVVSRPIPLDFLTPISFEGNPERRTDFITPWRGVPAEPQNGAPERLMWPFTIATSPYAGGKTYTLCAGTKQGREAWKEKIENAKLLRKFDLESNRIFAAHAISTPPTPSEPILAADSFQWLGRKTIAVATQKTVYIGWQNDSRTFREMIRLNNAALISAISVVPDFGWLLVVSFGNLYAYDLKEMMPASDPATWVMLGRDQARVISPPDKSVVFVRVGFTKGRLLVVHATHSRNSHMTSLTFDEPLLPSSSYRTASSTSTSTVNKPDNPFRRYATLTLPGYATDLSFFRQTIAVVMEKGFIIAEPGNPSYHSIPSIPTDQQGSNNVNGHYDSKFSLSPLMRMITSQKALGMYQVKENEFLLVYEWGGCYVTKYGEISRNLSYLRWNLCPTYSAYRPPHVLLFDEIGGRAEVRDVHTGKMCEIVEYEAPSIPTTHGPRIQKIGFGFKPVHLVRVDSELLALTTSGLIILNETVEL